MPHLRPARPSTANGRSGATSTTRERWRRWPPSREGARSSVCRPVRLRRSGASKSCCAVAGGVGFLWEINGTDGTLRITADAPYPGIFPLTVAGAKGQEQLAELAVPAALTETWPELASLNGTPAYNVGRAYAAFAADLDDGTHTVP